jgi:hypothetical protein
MNVIVNVDVVLWNSVYPQCPLLAFTGSSFTTCHDDDSVGFLQVFEDRDLGP